MTERADDQTATRRDDDNEQSADLGSPVRPGGGSVAPGFMSPDGPALVDAQLRVAHELLFSPPVQTARRASLRWSAPLSPESLEAELAQATRTTKQGKAATAQAAVHSHHTQQQAAAAAVGQRKAKSARSSLQPANVDEDQNGGHARSRSELPSMAALLPDSIDLLAAAADPPAELQLHLADPVAGDAGARLLADAIVGAAPSLTSLVAFVQRVGDPGAQALADALRTPSLALRSADMRFRNLAWTGAFTLCQSLAHLPRLQSLSLRCCSLGDEGTRWLVLAFLAADERMSQLTHLCLDENGITDIGCLALGQLLMRHHSLTSLSLEENSIGTRGAYVLGKAMATWQGQQRPHLDMPSSPPTQANSANVSAASSPHHSRAGSFSSPKTRIATTLNSLQPFAVPVPFTPRPTASSHHRVASHVRSSLGDTIEEDDEDGVVLSSRLDSAFAAALPGSDSSSTSQLHTSELPAIRAASDDHPCVLRVLNLRYNKIDVNDMSVAPNSTAANAATFSQPQSILARYLTVAPDTTGLVSLNLSLNSMGDEGAVVLARSLAHNLSLTSLNVNYCHISDKGGVAIARALAFNTTLTELHLALNFLTTTSAVSFSDSLSINTTLRLLDLSTNLLVDDSVWATCDALAANLSLTSLDLHANYLGDDCAFGLATACMRNTTLTYINVDGNRMTSDGMRAVEMALAHDDRGSTALPIDEVAFASHRRALQAKISALMLHERPATLGDD